MFYWVLQNFEAIWIFFGKTVTLIVPFLIGISIAFILNIPMQALESKFSKKIKPKHRRLVSLLLTILLMFILVLVALLTVIPEIGQTLETLLAMLPGFIDSVTAWGKQLSTKFPNLGGWLSKMDLDWENIGKTIFNVLKNGVTSVMNSTISVATSIFNGILNFFLGFVLAVYLLFQKENLGRQAKRSLYAFLPEAKADRLVKLCNLVNQTFAKFIAGQCIEAIILGSMFVVAMSIFRFPYVTVIAVLVTATALIPIFGALIACLIGALLILVTSPVKAFWFVLLFLVLQQIEGNFIYPRVVGRSVGLPALWVMSAVLIGGGLMGITGMLLSVPLCSVFYVLFRESINERLAKKHLSPERF